MRTGLIQAIQLVSADRHKLVILLGGFGAGKTDLLKNIVAEIDGKYINLNLELTERLLTLPRRKYDDGVTAHELIDKLCDELSPNHEPLLIDNVEILFSPELGKLNPIDTFKRISRQRPIVITLPARRVGNYAEYSALGQADHFRMSLEEFVYLDMRDET